VVVGTNEITTIVRPSFGDLQYAAGELLIHHHTPGLIDYYFLLLLGGRLCVLLEMVIG